MKMLLFIFLYYGSLSYIIAYILICLSALSDYSYSFLFSVRRQRGDTLYEVLTLPFLCFCFFTNTLQASASTSSILSVSSSVAEADYYYSSLFAAVVAMATAGVRQQF